MRIPYLMSLVVVLSAASFAVADQPTRNSPSGSWAWQIDVGDDIIDSTLKLTLDGKELTGIYSDQNVREKIQNGKFDGTTLSFDLEFLVDGIEVKVTVSAKTEDDKIKGTADVSMNGEDNTFIIDGKRKTRAADVAGVWKLKVETSEGEYFSPVVTLKAKYGQLSGTYSGPTAGTHELKELSLKKNVLKFTITGDAESDGSTFTAVFSGIPRGDDIKGKSELEINGAVGTAEVSGKRQPAKKDKAKS